MTTRFQTAACALCGAAAWLLVLGGLGDRAGTAPVSAQEAPAAAEGDFETLAAGAVHEAFAEPVLYDPEPGEIVAKQPPEPIEELPPDSKPEGDNIVWIPGYWMWDDDKDNFVWISGFWRDVPPDREWVPGYWTKAPDGWQWVAGYWSGTEEEEVDYLPAAPPATLETGPTVPPPSSDYIWVPGCWMWRDVRYVWRPGYWVVARPNWVWVPARYVWTPGGFVYVSGYWDMPVARRGLLFAPVFFTSPVYVRPAYRFAPSVVVNVSLFTSHLWVRPSWGCYYFGDYYATRYVDRGFHPWHKFHAGRHGYDPIYVQQYHQHVHIEKNREWTQHLQRDFTRHVDVVDSRPPRNYSTLAIAGAAGAAGASLGLVASLNQVHKASNPPVKLQTIDEDKRQQFAQKSKETREFVREREKIEALAGEGRPIPRHKTGRPDRGPGAKVDDTGKVAQGTVPKLEGPRPPGAKDGDQPEAKPPGEATVKKMGRPRSPVGDRGEKGGTAKRDVPPRLEPPAGKLTASGSKPDDGKPDAPREKGGPTTGRPKRGDDDGRPNPPSVDTTPKGKPRDLPRDPSPPGKSKGDSPRTAPKVDPPKTDPPKVDPPKPPRTVPKADPPRTAPKPETPKKSDPPRTNPPTRGRNETPGGGTPRTGGGSSPRNEPKNEPRNKGRSDKKDRASTGPLGNDDERGVAGRALPRGENRVERASANVGGAAERGGPRAPLASAAARAAETRRGVPGKNDSGKNGASKNDDGDEGRRRNDRQR